MEDDAWIGIFGVGIAISIWVSKEINILYSILNEIKVFLLYNGHNFIIYILDNLLYLVFGLLFIVLLGYNIFQLLNYIISMVRSRKKELDNENEQIESILNINPNGMSSNEIKHLINELENIRSEGYKNKRRFKFKEDLNHLISESKKALKEAVYNGEISFKKEEIKSLTEEIQILQNEKRQFEYSKENDKKIILSELDTYENPVFKKEDLTKDQIEALLEDKYVQKNEYCVKEQKIITAFVKPDMNHSKTHTFLVWSTMNLLDRISGVDNIQKHKTVETDITFNYKKKKYAIEIETENLLRKKIQMKNKFRYLNRKFKDRWLVIVSNRNLLPDYRKFGSATDRKGVAEKIKKMLEN